MRPFVLRKNGDAISTVQTLKSEDVKLIAGGMWPTCGNAKAETMTTNGECTLPDGCDAE